jgi:hypothetical protein
MPNHIFYSLPPLYRRYTFLKKIPKYKTPVKFVERFVEIFHTKI